MAARDCFSNLTSAAGIFQSRFQAGRAAEGDPEVTQNIAAKASNGQLTGLEFLEGGFYFDDSEAASVDDRLSCQSKDLV